MCTFVGFLYISGEGGEEDIDHGEDQEERGLGGLPLQVSHSTYISKHIATH